MVLCAALLSPLALAGVSCVTTEEAKDKDIPVWPNPPDPPRFTCETTLRSSRDIESKSAVSTFIRMASGKESFEVMTARSCIVSNVYFDWIYLI